MLKVFIGCDPVEQLAYHVLADSILRQSSVPVSISPVYLGNLRGIYTRALDERQSNSFSFSRFLVPYLCDYDGLAVFMDCDMLVRTDIRGLFEAYDGKSDVMCVQHDYTPKSKIKYLGNVQYEYPRKNWSSVMLFNCAKCRTLTTDYVASASAADLHRMRWAEQVGELDAEWNWLVGEYERNDKAKILHWTIGGPWFSEFEHTDYSDEWYAAMRLALNVSERSQLVLSALQYSPRYE